MTGAERDLDEWDAEIEAEFQREVAATKAAGRRKKGRRLVAFPLAFLVDVCRLTEGRGAELGASADCRPRSRAISVAGRRCGSNQALHDEIPPSRSSPNRF